MYITYIHWTINHCLGNIFIFSRHRVNVLPKYGLEFWKSSFGFCGPESSKIRCGKGSIGRVKNWLNFWPSHNQQFFKNRRRMSKANYYKCTCMYVCMYVYIHECICICTCTCMYVVHVVNLYHPGTCSTCTHIQLDRC